MKQPLVCPNCGDVYGASYFTTQSNIEREFLIHLKNEHNWSRDDAERYIKWRNEQNDN